MKLPTGITIFFIPLLISSAAANSVEFPPMYGSTPDTAVKNWIKYLVLGPQNAPFPIVWISPQHFKIFGFPEYLVVLPSRKYKIVDEFTMQRVAKSDCGRVWPERADWYTFEISKNTNGNIQRCIIPKESACRYLSEIINLPIKWSSEQQEPLDILIKSMKCNS